MSNINENSLKGGKKRLLRAESRRILSEFEGRPLEDNDFQRDGNGRPFFSRVLHPDMKVDFNISHSGQGAAVSYFSGGNTNRQLPRLGCDIELVRQKAGIAEIVKNFFSPAEREFIFSQSEILFRFYEIWTLKESFIKLRGLSVFDMKSVPSFIDENGAFAFCSQAAAPLFFNLYEISLLGGENSPPSRYILASAVEGAGEEPEIRCFSQLSFECKKTAEIKAGPKM